MLGRMRNVIAPLTAVAVVTIFSAADVFAQVTEPDPLEVTAFMQVVDWDTLRIAAFTLGGAGLIAAFTIGGGFTIAKKIYRSIVRKAG